MDRKDFRDQVSRGHTGRKIYEPINIRVNCVNTPITKAQVLRRKKAAMIDENKLMTFTPISNQVNFRKSKSRCNKNRPILFIPEIRLENAITRNIGASKGSLKNPASGVARKKVARNIKQPLEKEISQAVDKNSWLSSLR